MFALPEFAGHLEAYSFKCFDVMICQMIDYLNLLNKEHCICKVVVFEILLCNAFIANQIKIKKDLKIRWRDYNLKGWHISTC